MTAFAALIVARPARRPRGQVLGFWRTPGTRPGSRSASGSRCTAARLVVAFLLAALLGAPAAHAQSSRDLFAPPMTSRDVDALALRLELTPAQRLAIDPPHARYLERYADLQERELEPFITRNLRSWRRFIFNPDPEQVKDILRDFDRFASRIAAMDEQFLAEIDGVLADDQRARMPRIRSRRALDRDNSGLLLVLREAGGAGIDVARLTETVPMPDEDRAVLAPRLQSYEMQLAQSRDRLKKRGETAIIEIVEIASGLLRDAMAGNISFDGTVWEEMEGVVIEKATPLARTVRDLSTANRRSLNEWRNLVSEPTADRLALAFWSRGYRQASRPVESALGQYDRALRLPGLGAAERDEIASMRSSLRLDLMQQADQLIGRIDAAQTDPDQITARGGPTRLGDQAEAAEERLKQAAERGVSQLHAMLGADRTELLDKRPEDGGPAAAPTAGSVAVARRLPSLLRSQPEVAELQLPDATFAAAADFVPGPIAGEELDWYLSMLGLTADEREVAEAVHLDYMDGFDAFAAERIEPYKEMADRAEFQPDEDPDDEAARQNAIQQIPAMRDALVAEVESMDEAFLDLMGALVINPNAPAQVEAMERVRRARERVRMSRGSARELLGGAGEFVGRMEPSGGSEEQIDLTRLVYAADTPELAALADPVLRSYEASLTDALRRRMTAWRGLESTLSDMAIRPGEGREFWTRMGPAREAVRAARTALVELNRGTLDRIVAVAGPEIGEELQSRYRRTAYARAYRDRRSAEPSLLFAMDLDSMDDGRRARIARLLADYRPEYRRLSDEIVDIRQAEANERGEWQQRWQRDVQRRVRQEQLEFERDELSGRTLRQLRVLLSDEEAFDAGFRVDGR